MKKTDTNIQANGILNPLAVIATEKGAFRSPSTKVANFTYIYFADLHIFCHLFWLFLYSILSVLSEIVRDSQASNS